MSRKPAIVESDRLNHCDLSRTLRRADGVVPYNDYLWPMRGDYWNLGHEHPSYDSFWTFWVVGLADGRWSTTGSVYSIACGVDTIWGMPCVFTTRSQAVRAAAARLIRRMRASASWDTHFHSHALRGSRLSFGVNWVLQTVARETQSARPLRLVRFQDQPEPVPTVAGQQVFAL